MNFKNNWNLCVSSACKAFSSKTICPLRSFVEWEILERNWELSRFVSQVQSYHGEKLCHFLSTNALNLNFTDEDIFIWLNCRMHSYCQLWSVWLVLLTSGKIENKYQFSYKNIWIFILKNILGFLCRGGEHEYRLTKYLLSNYEQVNVNIS